ncbi:hypothetical protein QQF54_08515 [Lelliottia sp. V106_10]|uniref:hypothetical protein n=1 Tax=Lelliottia wanjuensis TaxID=3050585 RepID=UPI00254C43B1|nr:MULTISPECIES: hypothetical protein [unclassified Lelliottia]MDK9373396.1 hypothetical protein [Lelliottia sp. V106_10]MDK9600189.1 hypothetical protein [Lelliottia sp. V106_5]
MSIQEKDNVFYCDCGFTWHRGNSGAHDCGKGLRLQIVDLTAAIEKLQSDQRPIYIGIDFAAPAQGADYQGAIDLLRTGAANELDNGCRAHHNALIFAANVLENAQAFGAKS